MKYTILSSRTMVSLIELVNTRIADGWQPIGGVHSSIFQVTETFYQSMIKPDL